MKSTTILFAILFLFGCSKAKVEQAESTPLPYPPIEEVKIAVTAAAIQKGIIVTSVEPIQGDLVFRCDGELKTKPIKVSDTLTLSPSDKPGEWQGSIKFDLNEPINVIVKEQE